MSITVRRLRSRCTPKESMASLWSKLAWEQGGQMAVELALLIPAVLVVALMSINILRFTELVARFDRVAPDAVLIQGVVSSGSLGDVTFCTAIANQILDAMPENSCKVEVKSEQISLADSQALFNLSAGTTRYTCTLSYAPWPVSVSIAGAYFQLPLSVTHEVSLVVDRYRNAIIA